MKKVILLTLGLLMILVSDRSGDAASSFQIVLPASKTASQASVYTITNLSAFQDAQMAHFFYAGGYPGGSVVFTQMDTLSASQSRTYDLAAISGVPMDFAGDVVIAANQPITGTVVIKNTPPALTGVLPSVIPADQATTLTVSGANFLPTPTLWLGDVMTLTVALVSSTTLTATAPTGLVSGWYTVTLTNPDGQAASLANALRVDGLKPVAGPLAINKGAIDTTALTVTLSLSVTDTSDNASALTMSFSNDKISWGAWQPFSVQSQWNLSDGSGLKTVYARFKDACNLSAIVSDTITLDPTPGMEYSLTINHGALYTNQTAVTLTVGARPGTTQMQISNDGGFGGAAWEAYRSNKPWVITQYGNYVVPRIVYVRYKDIAGGVSSVYLDDIILDVTAPLGSVVISTTLQLQMSAQTVTLLLSATDDVSGVGWMLISNREDFAGASWEAYGTARTWSLGDGQVVYVRFRDRAGNVSQTYTASPISQHTVFLPLVIK